MVEALCEIVFAYSIWDDTVPGQFYERVKDRFPEKGQRELQQTQVALSSSGEATAGVRRLAPRLQLSSKDQRRLIQLEQDLLVVNQLPPYPHFEQWKPEVDSAVQVYKELTKPAGVKRLGLRYINTITIPGGAARLEDYFTVYPRLPLNTGDLLGGFLVRFEVPRQSGGHTVLVTFATAPPDRPGENTFLLDLHDIYQPDLLLDLTDVDNHVRMAHENILAAFEGSITDRLRQLFETED